MEDKIIALNKFKKQIDSAESFIRDKIKLLTLKSENKNTKYENPNFGIICGSGLGSLGNRLKEPIVIEYSEIPGFPLSTVKGHHGSLVFGLMRGIVTVCMLGRFHFYEGYDLNQVTLPIRVLWKLGVRTLLVSNAAGGIDESLEIGDLMAIEDHISFPNLTGNNPLLGPNLEEFGPRFTALTRIYHKKTFELLKRATEAAGYPSNFIKRGIYCGVGGPTYETPAEINLIRMVGGSVVGMSTIPEVTVAAHCGFERILAFSLVTNRCISSLTDDIAAPSHAEVLENSRLRIDQLEVIVENLVSLLYDS